jgi:hypothetical protein
MDLCGLAFIVVVEAPDFWYRDHTTLRPRLDGALFRTIHLQRQMCAPRVVIAQVTG